MVTQQTSLITLVGDVRSPAVFPAFAAGERILDTISRAGGTVGPGEEEWVMLERRGRRAMSPFGALSTNRSTTFGPIPATRSISTASRRPFWRSVL